MLLSSPFTGWWVHGWGSEVPETAGLAKVIPYALSYVLQDVPGRDHTRFWKEGSRGSSDQWA